MTPTFSRVVASAARSRGDPLPVPATSHLIPLYGSPHVGTRVERAIAASIELER